MRNLKTKSDLKEFALDVSEGRYQMVTVSGGFFDDIMALASQMSDLGDAEAGEMMEEFGERFQALMVLSDRFKAHFTNKIKG